MIAAGEKKLTLADVYNLLYKNEKIEISSATLQKAADNFDFLRAFAKTK